ncbi:hypothetical protein [Gordonia sp. NPDC058843]|uniref:hypothetical protein n=1 Tax=Gordonia sp. NPDC058843 TaxID=3346648 RepID=UPI0036758E34
MTGTRGRRTPRTTASIAACAVIAAAVVGCGSDWEVDPATESVLSSTANTEVPDGATATSTVSASSVTDTSDLANLMAISTHVFTGRVESGAGTTALDSIPETQYLVRTGVSIKGSVPEEVVVNQQGGITDRVYISVNGDTPLTVGQWYLFATRYLEAQNWYTLIPVHGRTPVTQQQAYDPASPPLAAAATALRAHPHSRPAIPDSASPSLTFPTPQPGDHHPPPPSPAQPG